MTVEKDKNSLRITDQFRGKRGMIYEFKCAGVQLAVNISPRMNPDDLGDWRVDVSSGRNSDAVVLTEWGQTRAGALFAVGRSWAEEVTKQGLPPFDWEAITRALHAVRAL